MESTEALKPSENDIEKELELIYEKFLLSESPEYLTRSQGYKALCYALKEKRVEVAKALVLQGAAIQSTSRKITDTPLHLAIYHSDYELVQFLLEKGADPLAVGKTNARTPLHVATIVNSLDIVKLLLDYGAVKSLNTPNQAGLTPLHVACKKGSLDIVKLLLDNNADLNYQSVDNSSEGDQFIQVGGDLFITGDTSESGSTPLFGAIDHEKFDVFNYLVECGADVTITLDSKRSLLHYACYSGNLDIVKHLLKYIDINCQDDEGHTPLTYSIKYKPSLDMFQTIVKAGGNVQSKLKYGTTTLHLACRSGDLDIVTYLIEHIDVNSANDMGKTPIYFAIEGYKGYDLDIFNLLLKHGADVTLKMKDNCTTLHYACMVGNIEMIQYILNHVDINSQDNDGLTPLYQAILKNHIDVFNLLINSNADITLYKDSSALHLIAGLWSKETTDMQDYAIKYFDVNIQDDEGLTPLHIAAKEGQLEKVKFLIKSKCDVNIKSKTDKSALRLAIIEGLPGNKIIECLLEAGAVIDPELIYIAAYHKNTGLDIIKLLVKYGANVNFVEDTFSMTALHYAAWRGYTDMVKFLVEECKADITLQNYNNRTPLNFAAFGNYLDILKILLKAGADPNIIDVEDKSPLLSSSREGYYEIVETLLQFNADINIRNKYGGTPLHVAAYHNQLDTVKLLIKNNADVNAKNNLGKVAFHDASLQRNVKVMGFLLDAGSIFDNFQIRSFETTEVLEKHVTKCKAADIYIDRETVLKFTSTTQDRFYQDCTKEINLLKSDGPGNQNRFSFFDILKKHSGQIEFYIEPQEITNCSKWHQLGSRFPIYGDMIYCKYIKALNGITSRNKKRR